MPRRLKGQRPTKYRPSATRRSSGLSPIREVNENFAKVWRTLVAHLARSPKRSPANSPGVWVRKGRFRVKEPSMRQVGRFLVY